MKVRHLLVDGTLGTSLNKTDVWFPDGRLVVVVHFPSALEVGNEIYIKLEVAWPGKCTPLIHGQCDRYTLRLDHWLTYARYKIVLPRAPIPILSPSAFWKVSH